MHQSDSTKLADFYASIVSCSNTTLQCPRTINQPGSGHAPRGFYFEGTPGDVDLLVVGKNPGHPIGAELDGAYRSMPATDLAVRAIQIAGQHFVSNADLNPSEQRSTTFHRNLLRYLSYFLDIPIDEVFRRCAYTNLVKCSTIGEQDRLPLVTMRQCYAQHLLREVVFLRPKVIVALGREVERFLKRSDVLGTPRREVVHVKHPSYYYRRNSEQNELARIKAQIRLHVG